MNKQKPTIIAIGGLSGSGKTTLTNNLAEAFNNFATVVNVAKVSSDFTRKKLWAQENGQSLDLYTELPDEAYDEKFRLKTFSKMLEKVHENLEHNDIVLVESIFTDEKMRECFQDLANTADANFIGLWLDAPVKKLLKRTDIRAKYELSESDADKTTLKSQLKFQTGDIDWTVIDAGESPDKTLQNAVYALTPHFL